MKSFYSFVFGCRVNEAEKVVMDEKLLALGFVWQKENPDFYIINSCAVTGKAEREVRQHIYQTRKKFPNTTIVVTGCAATNWKRNAITVKEVDMLITNDEKQSIPSVFQTLLLQRHSSSLQPQRANTLTYENDKFLSTGRLMIKIQDGCDRFCSYCIVPSLRGMPKSRNIKEITTSIKDFQQNMRQMTHDDKAFDPLSEVILTAINTECFGKDTGETLIELIATLLKETSVPIISFGSIHPWSITNEFLSYYQSILSTHRFLPFFHIPIQSGSDTILTLMNRGYTAEDMMKKLHHIKTIDPHAFIGTDIIVGFPGEGEKEFQETYTFLKNAPIDKIHVFRYSERPGTASVVLQKKYGEPTPQEKRKRSKLLLELHTKN